MIVVTAIATRSAVIAAVIAAAIAAIAMAAIAIVHAVNVIPMMTIAMSVVN